MIQAILTDIEGTTSSLSFVKDELFPYARAQLPEYVRQHQNEAAVKQLIADTCREAGIETDTGRAVEQLVEWMDQDKKVTPLKALQGLIWQAGYERGELQGHLYPDAAEQLNAWKQHGIKLYVYSSGSVLAQKLLFGHTEFGDLTPLFSGFFDTNIGGKKEPESYRKISKTIGIAGSGILFLSDIKEELDAAKLADYRTVWLVRDGVPEAGKEHRQASSFAEIELNKVTVY